MLPKLNVTLIGCGHYAKDLIYPKYKEHPGFNVKATISPNSSIDGVPAFRTIWEWKNAFGYADVNDVFDLCLHSEYINYYLAVLKEIGAKNIILPKPISETWNELGLLVGLASEYRTFVASQWAFDNALDLAMRMANKIKYTFQQKFKGKQNIRNAFLPHVAQLCYKAGIETKDVVIELRNGNEKIREVEMDGRKINLLECQDLFGLMLCEIYCVMFGLFDNEYSVFNYLPIAEEYLHLKERFQ